MQKSDEVKGQRSLAGSVKVARVLRPIRGKNTNVKSSQGESERISGTRSASTSSLSSEVIEEGPPDAPREEAADEPLLSEASVEKPRSPSRVSEGPVAAADTLRQEKTPIRLMQVVCGGVTWFVGVMLKCP